MRGKCLYSLLFWGLCACNGEMDEPYVRPMGSESVNEVSHGMIVLGEQLDDPYSLGNMTKALQKTYPTKAREVEVKATDIYVRFLPKNDREYQALVDDGITLMDHPLDYEIVKEGDYYHDPDLDESEITWQYAVVSPDYNCPSNIRYEVLDQCFVPEHYIGTKAEGIDWELVEREAYSCSGNEDMLAPQTRSGSSAPSGRITLVDENYNGGNPSGLSGVMVVCNAFVKFAKTYTDDEGYYAFDTKFSSDIRYRIFFSNSRSFAIGFNLLLIPASVSTMGTNPPEGVDLEITSSSERKLFARSVVNNAVCEYYGRCEDADEPLNKPPYMTRIWLMQNLSVSSAPMLQQGTVIDNSRLAKLLGEYKGLVQSFLPDITIGLSGADDYKSIYALACHEMAHASHFSKVGKDYWDKYIGYILKSYSSTLGSLYGTGTETDAGYCELGEMWAYFMENLMVRSRYGDEEALSGTSDWFTPQILMLLDERGLGPSKILAAYGPDVINVAGLRKRLCEMNPMYESMINQAFDRYGK